MVRVGGGGGRGLSVTQSQMESDRWNGKWGEKGRQRRWKNFLKGRQETIFFFFTPCVYTQNAQILVEKSNMDEKYKKIRPPYPTSKLALAAGIHLSLVTCHSRGGGLQGGGGGAL